MDQKAWIVSVNMGYGHQRTAYALKSLSGGEIINANDYHDAPGSDRKIWEGTRKFYESISNFRRFPLIGQAAFSLYDELQKIISYYPKRDLSSPNFSLRQIFFLIKRGWGKDLIERLSKTPLPFITTFFIPAFMAEFFNYPGEIFCIICDADISRSWAPLNPKASRIKYFVPTERAADRLKLYGVRPENILLTGYPLPLENIGTEKMEILKEDLGRRLLNLDPRGTYAKTYKVLIEKNLGKLPEKSNHPLTVMFSVGGAGAQREIGDQILNNLKDYIRSGQIKIILSVGVKKKVKEHFAKTISNFGLSDFCGAYDSAGAGNNIEILFGEKFEDYFNKFNRALRNTDILWTKPSELSFYSALGVPIIIAPPIGYQEEFNQRWILKSGFGISQENPRYADQWLFDWINQGYLAEAAMEGFAEGEKLGVFNILNAIKK